MRNENKQGEGRTNAGQEETQKTRGRKEMRECTQIKMQHHIRKKTIEKIAVSV